MTRSIEIAMLAAAFALATVGCRNASPAPAEETADGVVRSERGGETGSSTADSAANAVAAAAGSADPDRQPPSDDGRKPQPSVERRRDGKVVEATFDDIKFEMEQTEAFRPEMLTPEIDALLDRPIRLRGYMLPTMRRSGLKRFVLVRDNQECCFGPGAALYDCVLVEMEVGTTVDYSIRPVAVEGTFRFQELKDPVTGRHLAVFRMDGRTVK